MYEYRAFPAVSIVWTAVWIHVMDPIGIFSHFKVFLDESFELLVRKLHHLVSKP
jgi:hypothetical protein